METMLDLVLYLGIFSVLFAPCCILAWFTENTKVGRRLMDWILWKMGIDFDDDED